MTAFHRDYETRSACDLKKTGASRYMRHPTTSIWCASYALGDGPVGVWSPGEPVPAEFIEAEMDDDILAYAHNNAFEQLVEKHIAGPRHGLPIFPLRRQRCTMVQAYAMALPGALEQLAPALGLDELKDAAGKRLMLQLSRPRKVALATGFREIPDDCLRVQEMDDDGWEVYETVAGKHVAKVQWWNDSEKIVRLKAYCAQDTVVERHVGKRLRPLKDSEQALWELDQLVNQRGVFVDTELCRAAKAIVAKVEAAFDEEMQELTAYEVTACSNRNEIIRFIKKFGIDTESIAKDQVEEILGRTDLDPKARRVLELRKGAARASVDKINSLLAGMDTDKRARGLLQFHAASTGRWAGRRFQPQNIKRPDLDLEGVQRAVKLLRTGDYESFNSVYDDPLSVVGDCVRGMIAAAPGHRIIACDYSNIEGRVLAWLAGEHWKIEAFKAYDRGEGPDLYKVTAAAILGKPVSEITKGERQSHGKVPELACGFQGANGAFRSMAVVYGVDLEEDVVTDIVAGWRERHPATKQYWYDLERAAIDAIEQPGVKFTVGRISFKKVGSFLFMRLPSGRLLSYAYPRMTMKEMPWKDNSGNPVRKLCFSYMGLDSYTRKWQLCFGYGGLFAENATSGTARDILADAMPRLEAARYPIVLTVHDEAVAEPLIGHGSLEEMKQIMATGPSWSDGLPIAVDGFEAEMYGK